MEEENHFSAIEKEILIFKTYLELLVLEGGINITFFISPIKT